MDFQLIFWNNLFIRSLFCDPIYNQIDYMCCSYDRGKAPGYGKNHIDIYTCISYICYSGAAKRKQRWWGNTKYRVSKCLLRTIYWVVT